MLQETFTAEEAVKSELPFFVTIQGQKTKVIPVDGEQEFNDVGMSHGFVHFKDPETGEYLGFCGTRHFEENAIPESFSLAAAVRRRVTYLERDRDFSLKTIKDEYDRRVQEINKRFEANRKKHTKKLKEEYEKSSG